MTDTTTGGMFSKLLDPSKEAQITTPSQREAGRKAEVSPIVQKEPDGQATPPLTRQVREEVATPKPKLKKQSKEEEFRVTLPLSTDTMSFLDQLERKIFSSRSVQFRSQQRITKNSVVRAWLKLLRELKVNFTNVEDEEDLYKRLKEAIEPSK